MLKTLKVKDSNKDEVVIFDRYFIFNQQFYRQTLFGPAAQESTIMKWQSVSKTIFFKGVSPNLETPITHMQFLRISAFVQDSL